MIRVSEPQVGMAKVAASILKTCVAGMIISLLVSPAFADRLHLASGAVIEVDEAWEDAQGVWFRRGNVTQHIERARVRRIERGDAVASAAPASEPPVMTGRRSRRKTLLAAKHEQTQTTRAAAPDAQKADAQKTDGQKADAAIQPAATKWIHLAGGAKVAAEEVAENSDGVWYRHGNLSIFVERTRIERISGSEIADAEAAGEAIVARSHTKYGWTTGSSRIDLLIRDSGERHGVDPFLIFCVMHQESRFSTRAVSHKGARGLMQLMPGTARRFGVRDSHDPAQNIAGGTRYLKELLRMFGGRVDLALASYNAGEGAVLKYGGKVPPYRETRDYVRLISARYARPG